MVYLLLFIEVCPDHGKPLLLWCVFGDRQSIGRGKLRANVATRIAFDQGMIFKPFLLVIVHFSLESRISAWIRSVLNMQKQPQRIVSRLKERHLSFHMGEA